MNAFLRYRSTVFDEVKKDHPGKSLGEWGKIISDQWKDLGDDQKKYETTTKM